MVFKTRHIKKNITTHRAVRETPYRLVFGIDPKKEVPMKVTADDQTKLLRKNKNMISKQRKQMQQKKRNGNPHPLVNLKAGKN